MTKLLELGEDAQVLVAVRTPQDAVTPVGVLDGTIEKIDNSIDKAMETVRDVSESVLAALKGLEVESAQVELGFQFTGTGRLYVVEAAAQGALKVTLVLGRRSP
jgi:Trypsin-co-occurring domain 1